MPVAGGVGERLRMLPAVDLDDQLRVEADEIDDEAIERHLPFEFQAFELAVAQRLPEEIFSLGGIRSHFAGESAVARWVRRVDQAGAPVGGCSIIFQGSVAWKRKAGRWEVRRLNSPSLAISST